MTDFAKYPALHWFSFYQLRRFLAARDFRSLARLDVMRMGNKGSPARAGVGLLRLVAHCVSTPRRNQIEAQWRPLNRESEGLPCRLAKLVALAILGLLARRR